MCVIFVANKKRPSEEMVRAAFAANPAGAGIAWREGGKVHWEKALDLDTIIKKVAKAPLPFVSHYRIPSCGPSIPQLCHPFPVKDNVPLALQGSINGFVMFHNGTWGDWRKSMLTAAIPNGIQIPQGKWSDSRAMAWHAFHFGVGILEMIDQKTIAFGVRQVEFFGDNWSKYEDVWVSNQAFVARIPANPVGWGPAHTHADHVHKNENICPIVGCRNRKTVASGYCYEHTTHRDGTDCRITKYIEDGQKKKNDVIDKRPKVEDLGGDPLETFRQGNNTDEAERDIKKPVQEGPKSVQQVAEERGFNRGADGRDFALVPINRQELDEEERWMRSFNTKMYHTGHPPFIDVEVDLERVKT